MFDSVTVANFMRISEPVNIPLGPVTVLVGENGSGKSSILKAIHWAVRCAALCDSSHRITLERMDYVPSRDSIHLSHKKRLNSGAATPAVDVEFQSGPKRLRISLRSTRNDAGLNVVTTGTLESAVNAPPQTTAYIPGLAGLSEAESLLATPVLHRRASSGEGGSVLRHILLGLAMDRTGKETIESHEELLELNNWVGKVFPRVRFWVKFDRLRDVFIDAKFLTGDMAEARKKKELQWKSLEMAGTGFLQVVQIFAYLLHFKPKLLLIDEPDSHLHPGTQELLISAVEDAAKSFPETQFLITTHSPSLVRAASGVSKVLWMENGRLRATKEESIRQRMGWGALDKNLILLTEDGNIAYMRKVLAQWPEIERKVVIWPTFGAGSLPHGAALAKIREEHDIAVLVHRDRDFMSNSDQSAFKRLKNYDTNNIPFWMPTGSDIESEFCSPEHLANVFDISNSDASALVSEALAMVDNTELEKNFNTAYQSAVGGIKKDEVSAPTIRWRDLQGPSAATIKGKVLLKQIEAAALKRYVGPSDIQKLEGLKYLSTPSVPFHEDLRQMIADAISNQKAKSPQSSA